MNYFKLITAFYDYQLLNNLSTGQIALWHALAYINNKCAWKEWFTVSNQVLELHTNLTRQTIHKAKNALKQMGYIDFKANGTKACKYKIIDISCKTILQDNLQASLPNSLQGSLQGSLPSSLQDSCTLNNYNYNYNLKEKKTSSSKRKAADDKPYLGESVPKNQVNYENIIAKWNSLGIHQVRDITPKRKSAIDKIIDEYGEDAVFETMDKAKRSSFLMGKDWFVFDWFIDKNKFINILEDKYKDKPVSKPRVAKVDKDDWIHTPSLQGEELERHTLGKNDLSKFLSKGENG